MKILRVRLDAELGEGLDRLKAERYVNVSAWVRALIRPALAQQLGTAPGSVGTLPPSTPESPPPATAPEPEPGLAPGPIPGWTPRGLPDGSWGSRYQGDTRKLPDDLLGCAIEVTTQGGTTGITHVVEVLEWTADFVLVRDSGKPSPA